MGDGGVCDQQLNISLNQTMLVDSWRRGLAGSIRLKYTVDCIIITMC